MHLVVDGNNVAWAGFHALRRPMGADTPEKLARAAFLGLTQSVIGLAIRGGEAPAARAASAQRSLFDAGPQVTAVTVVFDEGRPLRRRQVFPDYQTTRESSPAFRDFEPHVLGAIAAFIEGATNLPLDVLRGHDTEADDLVAALVLATHGPVRVASTDKDFLQLVDERVSVYSTVKRLVITTENFVEVVAPRTAAGVASGFPRGRYLDYRVMSGDPSDDLPGLPGVGTLTAARLLADAPLDDYLADPSRVAAVLGRKNARLDAAFADGTAAQVVARNRELMDLRHAALNYPDLAIYRREGAWDEAAFRAWAAAQRAHGFEMEAAVETMRRLAASA